MLFFHVLHNGFVFRIKVLIPIFKFCKQILLVITAISQVLQPLKSKAPKNWLKIRETYFVMGLIIQFGMGRILHFLKKDHKYCTKYNIIDIGRKNKCDAHKLSKKNLFHLRLLFSHNLCLSSLKMKSFGLVPNPLSCICHLSYIHQLGTRVLLGCRNPFRHFFLPIATTSNKNFES